MKRTWLLALLLFTLSIGTPLNAQDAQRVVYEPALEERYLPNPGIGWQRNHGMDEPYLPETVMYPQRSDISWKVLNPADGVYNWQVLDGFIEEAREQGKMLSFRIYTMIGEVYGGHQVPEWVIDDGATITEEGSPDYANCVYQDHWGDFVNALRERYDGHNDIAYIDISGYSNFNEWSWHDGFTEWDDVWFDAYNGFTEDEDEAEETEAPEETEEPTEINAGRDDFETLDGQTRRRLADIFIGGAYDEHECRLADGEITTVAYDYTGFQETQLVMPFAGVRQATQYVFSQRKDVGFRYDCLARSEDTLESLLEGLPEVFDELWKTAPIVYEYCAPSADNWLELTAETLPLTHPSLVHYNLQGGVEPERLAEVMRDVGYRYVLERAEYQSTVQRGGSLPLELIWYNTGYAPSYPKMGQKFELRLYMLTASDERVVSEFTLDADIASWMPATTPDDDAPRYDYSYNVMLPDSVAPGEYTLKIAMIDLRTGQPINLGILGRDDQARYAIGNITVTD